MTDHQGSVITCSCCDRTVANHRWGKIKATGWFFAKDGTAYCPEHVPEWVQKWRETRAAP
jgi:hypothetical protein